MRCAGRAFDFRAWPVSFKRSVPGSSIPGLHIFGAHCHYKHLLALLAVTLYAGLRGFLVGAAAWVMYKLHGELQ
jgi:hypothetical protein